MKESLYLQFEKNTEVFHPHIYLQDVCKLSCSSAKVLNRLRVLPVADLTPHKYGRYVMSAVDLIDIIRKKEPELDISAIGETDFIITYAKERGIHQLWKWLKTVFVCMTAFFGAAFSIMTFNNDVDVPGLFSQIYFQVTGRPGSGFTILEISYSIGIGLGVLIFFNHFGKMKLSSDPSPMQVQMRLYEDDVNTTIIEQQSREKKKQDRTDGGF